MNTTSIVLAAFLLGLITYIYRFSFISHKGRQIAERIPQSFLNLLAPATFAAIVTNHLATFKGSTQELQLRALVLALSTVVAALTRSILGTLVFGLILLYVLKNFVSV